MEAFKNKDIPIYSTQSYSIIIFVYASPLRVLSHFPFQFKKKSVEFVVELVRIKPLGLNCN